MPPMVYWQAEAYGIEVIANMHKNYDACILVLYFLYFLFVFFLHFFFYNCFIFIRVFFQFSCNPVRQQYSQ